jgi:rubrerythrin
MGVFFSGEELVRIAVRIEETGHAFYLKAMTESHLVAGDDKNLVMASKASDESSAVDFAIGFEKDPMLFFYQLADLVHSIHKPMVQAIINEEKEHIRKLAEMRKELN